MAKKDKNPKVEIKPKDKAELALEKVVFGDLEGFEKGLKSLDLSDYESEVENDEDDNNNNDNLDMDDLENVQDENLFMIDEGEQESDKDSDVEMENGDKESDYDSGSDADEDEEDAWADSDDEKLQISLTSTDKLRKLRKTMADDFVSGREYTKRLRTRFEKIYPIPKWAKEEEEKEQDSDISEEEDIEENERANPLEELLKTASSYLSSKAPKNLPPTQISITRLKDANQTSLSRSAIQTLTFHPTHPLLIASGYDRTLRMFHIDGKNNPVATTLHVRQSPFQTAQFHPDGRRVFAAGRRRYLYIWDIETGEVTKVTRMYGHEQTQQSMEQFKLSPCGRYLALVGGNGWMNVLSANNGQWICGAKVDGIIADIEWFKDGNQAMIATTGGDIYQWDVEQRRTVNRWKDEGGIGVTKIALGGDRWFAIGSNTGLVNIYDLNEEQSSEIYKPKATLKQLVTTISSLQFTSDCQILAFASRAKRDAFRLCHIPSFTVFQNWPTGGTPLGTVTSITFTPGNELLCTANEQGKARLWKLNHYENV